MIQIDIEPPKNCLCCDLGNDLGTCYIAKRTVNWGLSDRPSWCPIIEMKEQPEMKCEED